MTGDSIYRHRLLHDYDNDYDYHYRNHARFCQDIFRIYGESGAIILLKYSIFNYF